MKILNPIGIVALFIVAIMLGSTESSSQEESASEEENPCNGGGHYHTIQVRVGDDGEPVLRYRNKDGDKVRVCKNDKVKWVLIGPDRTFSVDFKHKKGAPFGDPPGQPQKRESMDYEIDVEISDTTDRESDIEDKIVIGLNNHTQGNVPL